MTDGSGDWVDGPALESRSCATDAVHVGVEHLRIADDVDDDGPTIAVDGVDRVVHVARLDLDPGDVAAIAWHHADRAHMLGCPRRRERAALGLFGEVDHWQVQEHCLRRRDREVVHHHRPRNPNLLRRHQHPERFGDVVAQRPVERHPEERQLLRRRVDLRVRRHRRTQLRRRHRPQRRRRSQRRRVRRRRRRQQHRRRRPVDEYGSPGDDGRADDRRAGSTAAPRRPQHRRRRRPRPPT